MRSFLSVARSVIHLKIVSVLLLARERFFLMVLYLFESTNLLAMSRSMKMVSIAS